MKRVEVRTKRLLLRPLTFRDYDLWFEAVAKSLPQQSEWDEGPRPARKCTRQQFHKLLKIYRDLARKDDYYRYYVFEKKTGKLIGLVDFDIYVRGSHQFANYGYRIFNRHWGNGYGQEAARAGLKIGFKQLKLNRLEAAINLNNKKSIRLVKAIGMKREGIKKRYWFENGAWADHLIYVANPEDVGLAPRKPI